jgi:hypothetical protein
VSTVGSTEGIAHVDVTELAERATEGLELFGGGLDGDAVLLDLGLFLEVETEVLEKDDLTRLKLGAGSLDLRTNTVVEELNGALEELLEVLGDGLESELGLDLTIRAAKVAHENDRSTALKDVVDGGKSSTHTVVALDLAVLHGDVEVDTHENTLALDLLVLQVTKGHLVAHLRSRTVLDGDVIKEEVDNTVAVTPLVIVPGNELDEGLVKSDTGLGIEDRGLALTVEIRGHDELVSVAEDALELTLRSLLDGSADLLIGGLLLELTGEINDRHVESGHTEGHASKLALKAGDNLGHSLGSTSGRGDDVASGSTTITPGLGRRTIDGLLGGSGGVDSGHETALHAEGLVDNLGKRSKAVGGAGSIGDDVLLGLHGGVVDTIDEHRSISRRSSDENLLGSTSKVSAGLLGGGESTRGFDNPLNTEFTPFAVLRIPASKAKDFVGLTLIGDGKLAVLANNGAREATVHGIITEHVSHSISLKERIIQGNKFNGHATFDENTKNKTTNTTKTVNSNLCHFS